MLPPRLSALRTELRATPNPTTEQADLLNELDGVSQALDEAGSIRKSITEDLERTTKRAHSAWGGSPGTCQCCGR